MNEGKIFVIVSCSGTGKTTLIKRLREDFPHLEWSVSCTTRPPRRGEVDGKDYFFIDADDFQKRRDNDEFVEWAQVHSNFYGTSKQFVDQGLAAGKWLLFDIDIQGADAIKAYYQDKANVIFIAPPSIEELERRLRGRGTDSDEVICERLANASTELLRKSDYDYLVLNDDIEVAYEELKNIVSSVGNR